MIAVESSNHTETVPNSQHDVQQPSPENCSWDDVLDSMEKASEEYKAKADGDRIQALRRNTAVAETLQSLADLIPEPGGIRILRVGLTSIFEVQTTARYKCLS